MKSRPASWTAPATDGARAAEARGGMSKRDRRIKVKKVELARIAAAEKETAIKKARKLEKKKQAAAAKDGDAAMGDATKIKRRKIKLKKHHIRIKALMADKKKMKP